MSVSSTVGSPFGLERTTFLTHLQTELHQHFLQDRISLELQKVFSELDRGVPVPQMVRGPHQGMRRLGSHEKDILTGRLDSNQCAVFCLQKISVAQQRSSGQEEGRFSSV